MTKTSFPEMSTFCSGTDGVTLVALSPVQPVKNAETRANTTGFVNQGGEEQKDRSSPSAKP
jgi:hypothetical protein